MLKFDAVAFYEATKLLNHAMGAVAQWKPDQPGIGPDTTLDEVMVGIFVEKCEELKTQLRVMEADVTEMAVNEVIDSLKSFYTPLWKEIPGKFADIDRSLKRELSRVHLRVIDRSKLKLYEPKEPLFGAEFQAKFQSEGVFELDEAGKCLALGRPTACVFHLMRIMEIGIRALARCLAIPDPVKPGARNWGGILREIWKGIEAKWPTVSDRMKGDGHFFEALYASLDAVKNPQRNATMHVEKKYTDDEAEDIFAAVKGFTRRLANRCDENGMPLA
jgi:hypothetical protein